MPARTSARQPEASEAAATQARGSQHQREQKGRLLMSLRTAPYKYLVAAAFLFGLFMDLMDLTIVNVALPALGKQFHASDTTLEWVVTGYLLSLAVWIPASGWIGDRFGTKKTFLFALAMFTAGSALCGLAQSIDQLIFFRVLQGIGGGMMTPVGTAMLFRAFPPNERARASVILTVPTVIAPALGPILGGWLVDRVSWHWIFYVNVPIGVAGFLFSLALLKEHREELVGSFDFWGFGLSGAGLALVLYALSLGPADGWRSLTVLGTGLAGSVAFILLVVVELRRSQPMLELRLFADRMFRNANIVMLAQAASLFGVLFLLTLFLQDLRGFSAIDTGLILLPQAIGAILFARLAGRLYLSVGPRRLLMTALALFALSSALLLLIGLATSVWWIAAIMFLRGIAIVFTFVPLQAATYATISPRQTGRASAISKTNVQIGSALGVAVLATVLAQQVRAHVAGSVAAAAPAAHQAAIAHGTLLGFHDAFLAAAIVGLIGVAFAFRIRDEDAVASMQPARPAQPAPEYAAAAG